MEDSLRLLLSLMCQQHIRSQISSIRCLPRFLQMVSTTQNQMHLSLIGTIIRRLEISSQFVQECSASLFMRSYLSAINAMATPDLYTQAASVIDVLLRKAYIPDFLAFLPYIKQLISFRGVIQQVCVTILFMLSKYPQTHNDLKQHKFHEVLTPDLLDKALMPYAEAVIQNIAKK